MRNKMLHVLNGLVYLTVVACLVMAVANTSPNRAYNLIPTTNGTLALGDSTHRWQAYVNEANVTSATITGVLTQGPLVLTNSDVSLTSPTVTFSAANKSKMTLNSNANQTGIYPTGGALGQIVTIISGAGSNTMRFDDATSMSLGANITLTEGQNDILTLICTSADGDEWAAVSAHDN